VSHLLRAVIDSDALRNNFSVLRQRAGRAHVIAVVKANAYGHGLVSTALALQDADGFAVARIEEGIALRAAGMTSRILLLEGVFSAAQLEDAAHDALDLVVHDERQIELLARAHGGAQRFAVWLKVDSGMHRLGFAPEEVPAALARLRALPSPPKELRLMTHLACADEADGRVTRGQLECFRAAARGSNCELSIANSAGLLGKVPTGCHWVRPGIALYGASPFEGVSAGRLGLRPVMTLTSSVIALRRVRRGEAVGYGGTWVAKRESQIATIAAGYGDGVHRSLKSGTPLLINGRRAAFAGRVSMDMLCADVTGIEGVALGTPVVLWGEGLPVEEVARHAGTIAYELLCGVSPRVPLELR
jgi:alanine racemase